MPEEPSKGTIQYPQKKEGIKQAGGPAGVDWCAIHSKAQKKINRLHRPWQGKCRGKRPKGTRFKGPKTVDRKGKE